MTEKMSKEAVERIRASGSDAEFLARAEAAAAKNGGKKA